MGKLNIKRGDGEPTKKEWSQVLKAVMDIIEGRKNGMIIVNTVNEHDASLISCGRKYNNFHFEMLVDKLQHILHPELDKITSGILKAISGIKNKKTGSSSKSKKK